MIANRKHWILARYSDLVAVDQKAMSRVEEIKTMLRFLPENSDLTLGALEAEKGRGFPEISKLGSVQH
jgi:hypothetical protein